jgi:hypothetical protein
MSAAALKRFDFFMAEIFCYLLFVIISMISCANIVKVFYVIT